MAGSRRRMGQPSHPRDAVTQCCPPTNNRSPSPPVATTARVSPLMPQCSDPAAAKVGISTLVAQIVGSVEDWWGRLQQR
jgi:hypothetical protein